jgi:hypothetical protein
MTNNCQWCESNTEAYFSGDLNPEDLRAFDDHLISCAECREQVQGIKDIDPGIQQVFQHRLTLARSAAQWNTGPRVWKVALAGASVGLAALLAVSILTFRQEPPAPEIVNTPPTIEIGPAPLDDPKTKSDPATNTGVLKPGEGTPVPPAPQPILDARAPEGPDFVISDPSGQAETLNDYRGLILVFGIVSSDQKEGMANLQVLHQDFGSNPNVRVRGVANHRDDKIDATFPHRFNHASRLCGLQNGQFMLVVDAGCNAKLKGSLANAADIAKVRAQLEQLTAK